MRGAAMKITKLINPELLANLKLFFIQLMTSRADYYQKQHNEFKH